MSKIIKQCFDDGFAEINGRKYVFCNVNHKTRLKIYGYGHSISHLLSSGDFSFMGSDEFSKIEDLMFSNMTYDNDSLIKIADKHFTDFGEDHTLLVTTAIRVFCYPFMKGTS